jgi:hypothetical protein
MKMLLLAALAAGTMVVAAGPAQARDGCGPGFHRGYYGRCFPNGGPGRWGPPPPPPGPVMVGPGGPAVGVFYEGRGYWDGHRYWRHRDHWHGGWRYR